MLIAFLVALGLWFRFKTLKPEHQTHVLKYVHWYSLILVCVLNIYLGGDAEGRMIAILIDTFIAGWMFLRHVLKPRARAQRPLRDARYYYERYKQ